MNYKILSLAVLALFVSLSFASALTFNPGSATVSLTQGANKTISLINDGAYNLTSIALSTPSVSGAIITVNPSNLGSLATGATSAFNFLVSSLTSSFNVGDSVSGVLNATGQNASGSTFNASLPVTFQKSFCRSGPAGNNLSITSVDIKNSGTDDTTWTLLDNVRVRVRVENVGDDTVRGISIVLGLFDANGVNRAGDLSYTSSDEDKVSYGSLKSGSDAVVEFDFQVPADFKADTYRLAVKAYSSNAGEDNLCTDSSSDLDHTIYQSLATETESSRGKYIAFDNSAFSPSEATCGDTVTLSTTAYNIGDNDEDRVKLTAQSDSLNFTLTREITSGLTMGESTPATFTFVVPQNAKNGLALINLYSDYEYNSNSGVYVQRSTNYATVQYNIVGCGTTSQNGVVTSGLAGISATLGSTVGAGKPLTVTSTITNNQNVAGTFVIDVSGYDSWATLTSLSDRALYLNPGQSKQVTVQLNVKSDASGQNGLTISAKTGQSVDSKDVVVTVPASGFSFGGSSTIWIIAGINVLLLVIIIVVAVRLANR